MLKKTQLKWVTGKYNISRVNGSCNIWICWRFICLAYEKTLIDRFSTFSSMQLLSSIWKQATTFCHRFTRLSIRKCFDTLFWFKKNKSWWNRDLASTLNQKMILSIKLKVKKAWHIFDKREFKKLQFLKLKYTGRDFMAGISIHLKWKKIYDWQVNTRM
jgi:hypothetical protein